MPNLTTRWWGLIEDQFGRSSDHRSSAVDSALESDHEEVMQKEMWCVGYGKMQGLGCDPPWKGRASPYKPVNSNLGMADMEELPQSGLLLPDAQDVQNETPAAIGWLLQRPGSARPDGSGTDNVG